MMSTDKLPERIVQFNYLVVVFETVYIILSFSKN